MAEANSPSTYVFVDPRVLLAHGLVPHKIARRKAHDQVDVRRAYVGLIDIVAQRVCLGKENLGQAFSLTVSGNAPDVSTDLPST
jgi:hypothetical protein